MKERERVFYALADSQGGVVARTPACGASIRFRNLFEFPKENIQCPCKKPGHFAVKFQLD
jgi:hypothetical protein